MSLGKHRRPIIDNENCKAWYGADDKYAKHVRNKHIRRVLKAAARAALRCEESEHEQQKETLV